MTRYQIKRLDSALLNALAIRAAAAPRRRTNHNFHERFDDPVQRLVVLMKKDTYIRPHRHAEEGKWEWVAVLRGGMDLLVFDEAGVVLDRIGLGNGRDALGVELPPGVWHTSVPSEDDTVFFEVKPGPYDAQVTSEFAPWSCPEGDPVAPAFRGWLDNARPGDRWPGVRP